MTWQPIETAPKGGSPVLLWCTDICGLNGHVSVGTWHEAYGGSWWDRGMEYTLDHASHWMPLPEPPNA